MRRSSQLLATLLPLVALGGCSSAEPPRERMAAQQGSLLAGSRLLWPMRDGRATISVCWLPLDMGGVTFPLQEFAPDLETVLPLRKRWIQRAVEAEWNGRTVVSFVGWQDCASENDADVMIRPISSSADALCGQRPEQVVKGGFCVQEIGVRGRGLKVSINVLFGDEIAYSARYRQTVTRETYVLENDVTVYRPSLCGAEADAATVLGASDDAIDAFRNVHRACLQNISLHEFGHVAGFSHEQNRKDISPECAARFPASQPTDSTDEDSPLGPFDTESIMSYCRASVSPTLTEQDVEATNWIYDQLSGSEAGKP